MFTRKRKKQDAGESVATPPAPDQDAAPDLDREETLGVPPKSQDNDGAPPSDGGAGESVATPPAPDQDAQLDEYRRRLFDALVVADGRVRDKSAVEYAPELVDDPDALAAKITSVIESRPEVGRNAAFGDVGAGESGDAPAPDLIDVIRAAHGAAD